MHRYTLYLYVDGKRPVRLDQHGSTRREFGHEVITDEPIPPAQDMSDTVVLDGGGRKVLRVIRVNDDEVIVHPEFRTQTIPFRNVADEEAEA